MKGKIQFVIVASFLLFILDWQFLRLSQLEYKVKENDHKIVQLNLEKDQIHQHLIYLWGQLEDVKLYGLGGLSSKVAVFQTTRTQEAISDATITQKVDERDFNIGGADRLEIGVVAPGVEQRVLIKFNEI
ncbi:MAG: hypothetical protein NUV91_08680, partial [Candidatus Omnitrophica bacterium]|nr:hypothetical protein [Candidatus Omnitrophota bacterium]